jgi:hypothetical protein
MPSEFTYPQPLDAQPLAVKEQDIETALVEKLRALKYTERFDIRDRATLEANFRQKFEALNRVSLTDTEFKRLLEELTIPDVFTAARVLREKNDFTRDDGTPLAYTLVNIRDWCKNDFEVVHQLRINTDYSHHRYDVLLLINGVPVVQIELKTLSVNPRRAMEQIVDYKNDPGNGYTRTLLCFIQLFIVSNRTDTVYFANNNARHFAFNADERFLPVYRFADRDNKPVSHLDDFADRFLQKCELGRMISRYMVLIQSEQKLLMMRPYQIYAVQAIVDCIEQNCGNGYIWHTTGSGKTLTSFKASTLLKDNPAIDKCLFVVDRKDLEQNIFVWCLFMAICERVIDGHPSYAWVKFFYIDDPISSLDDNNAIAVASDLAKLLRKAKDKIKVVVSSHHALFFNVVCNELKSGKCKRYFLHRANRGTDYTLRATDDTPFFHHVAMLSELQKAAQPDGVLYTYHFNMLRSVLEKTATFFGKKDFSACLEGVTDEGLYSRALNLLSHGKYSLYEPVEMLEDNKQLFRDILDAFLNKHAFDLPVLVNKASSSNAAIPAAASVSSAQPP